METIHALATAQGKSGVAVVRLSGPRSWEVVDRITVGQRPSTRRASVRQIVDGAGDLLDSALILLFDDGASFTGEQSAELHLHGSLAVIAAVLRRISEISVSRFAEPGEFTRRALMNNRLGLTEVEGLSDLIDAETETQRREAMRVFSGELSERVNGWRVRLIRASALLEATIDFADEDVPVDVKPEVIELVSGVSAEIQKDVTGFSAAQELRRGFEVALVGAPNVGKSTLLNALAGREAAITSEIAGTTRDIVEVRMDLGGLPVTFLDTAGIRETDDAIEQLGVRRAQDRAVGADLRVHLVDAGQAPILAIGPHDLIIESKADLSGVGVSAVTGEGLDELIANIVGSLRMRVSNAGLVSRERDRIQLVSASERLKRVHSDIALGNEELLAMEISGAVGSLETIIGKVGIEDVLDDVFSSFCIGK